MNPTLEKQRDELAVFSGMDADEANCFCKGFNAAIKLLTESAGEFDEKAFIAWINSQGDERTGRWPTSMQCAAWQFEQDAARIGLAETKLACVLVNHGKIEYEKMQLEARLAESEREVSVLKNTVKQTCDSAEEQLNASVKYQFECHALRDKLAASEAEVARMDALAAEWQGKFDEACEERDKYRAALEELGSRWRDCTHNEECQCMELKAFAREALK